MTHKHYVISETWSLVSIYLKYLFKALL